MIQADIINTKAVGIVGWRQSTRTGTPVVTVANIASASGLYFQMANGLVTVDNIKACVDDEAISDANLNTYLADIVKGALTDICHKIFSEDDHLDTGHLFKYENKFTETLTNGTDFVGFEFDLSKRNDLSVILNNVILEFDGVQSVKVLLFNSQKNVFYDSETIATVANTAKITPVDWRLNDLEYGGKWYVGYLRSALVSKAIKRNFQLSNLQTSFPGVSIRPVRVDSWNAETMFDPSVIIYSSDTWGMNFNLSVYKDFTQIILSNLNRFAKALQLQVCVNVVDLISNTVRSNKNERLAKKYAILELDGNRNNPNLPEHVGLIKQLDREIRRLKETYYPKGIISVTV